MIDNKKQANNNNNNIHSQKFYKLSVTPYKSQRTKPKCVILKDMFKSAFKYV